MIPKGEENFDLELIFEGRSFNDKVITEAYYTIAGEIRIDVGRRVLGHVDVFPVQFSETDGPVDMTLTIVDELGGSETYTHSLNPNNPSPLLFVDAIEYAQNSIVLFSNMFHDPYNQLEGFNAFEIDFGDGKVENIEDNFFQLTHTYAESGDYTVKITAEGQNGEVVTISDTISLLGSADSFKFPLADFKVERQEWAPGVRLYVDQSLSPNAPIMTYLWELGDGTTAYGPEVIHFYNAGGYDVTLTAILEDGTQAFVKREVIIMNDAPNIVSNLWCYDIGNLTLECELDAADKFNDLKTLFVNFNDNAEIEDFVLSKSVSGGFEVAKFTFTYDAPGTYDIAYLVETGRGEELLKLTQFSVTDTPGNQAPVADLSCFTFFNQVDCQAYGSMDPDGFLTEYRFDFGNGDSIVTDVPQAFYDYPEVGTYTVTLTVVDDFGVTATDSQTVTVEPGENQFPVANLSCFSENPNELTCDGRASYDVDGEITFARLSSLETGEFFETSSLDLLEKTFTFSSPGLKEVKIEVTDNSGVTVEEVRSFEAREALAPIVVFNCVSNNLAELTCDGSNSIPGEGEIVSFSWNIEGSIYEGPQITAQNLMGESVNVQLTVKNSFGVERSSLLGFQVSQNKPPIADFSCVSSSPWSLSCTNFSSDPEGDSLTYTWEVLGEIYASQNLVIENLGKGGEISVKLTVSDGKNIASSDSFINIKDNLPPTISLTCDSTTSFKINCNLNSSDPDGSISRVDWFLNGNLVESNLGEGVIQKEIAAYAKNADVKVEVFDNLGTKTTSTTTVAVNTDNFGGEIYCNQYENFSANCHLDYYGVGDNTPEVSWSVNGSFYQVSDEVSIQSSQAGMISLTAEIFALGESQIFQKDFLFEEIPPERILSNAKLEIINQGPFFASEGGLHFRVSNGFLKTTEDGNLENFNVYYGNNEGNLPFEVISFDGVDLKIKTNLTEGKNTISVSALDGNSNLINFEQQIFVGSKTLRLEFSRPDLHEDISFFFKGENEPFLSLNVSESNLVVENFPKQKVFYSTGSYPYHNLGIVLEEDMDVSIVSEDKSIPLNENGLIFENGLNGWSLSQGESNTLPAEYFSGLDGVTNEGVQLSVDSNGILALTTRIRLTSDDFLEMPIVAENLTVGDVGFVRAVNLKTGDQSNFRLDKNPIPSSRKQLSFFELPSGLIGDEILVDILVYAPRPEQSVFQKLLKLLPVSTLYANNVSPMSFVLANSRESVFTVKNLQLLDGQEHDKGRPLITFIQGNFPSAYSQKLSDTGENVYKVIAKASVSASGSSYFDQDLLKVFQVCEANSFENCVDVKPVSCKAQNFNSSHTSENRCEIYFSENDLNYSVFTPFLDLRIKFQSIMDGRISYRYFRRGAVKSFRRLRSASADGIIGGENNSVDRYGARAGSGLDGLDGADDWYASTHYSVIDFIMSTKNLYSRLENLKVDDISPTGVSSRDTSWFHSGHGKGIELDVRFVKETDLVTEIEQGSTTQIKKYEEDANGIISILNAGDGFISELLVTNSKLDRDLSSLKIASLLNGMPFEEKLITSCTDYGEYPFSVVRNAVGHSDHIHLTLTDIDENGFIARKDFSTSHSELSSVTVNFDLSDYFQSSNLVQDRFIEVSVLDRMGNPFSPIYNTPADDGRYFFMLYKAPEDTKFTPITNSSVELFYWQNGFLKVNRSHSAVKVYNLDGNLFENVDFKIIALVKVGKSWACGDASYQTQVQSMPIGECDDITAFRESIFACRTCDENLGSFWNPTTNTCDFFPYNVTTVITGEGSPISACQAYVAGVESGEGQNLGNQPFRYKVDADYFCNGTNQADILLYQESVLCSPKEGVIEGSYEVYRKEDPRVFCGENASEEIIFNIPSESDPLPTN